MSGSAHQLAKRYADALFSLAQERKILDEVATDVGALQAMLGKSADLRNMIHNPMLARGDQKKALTALAKAADFQEITRNFLALVAEKGRLPALSAMLDSYMESHAVNKGEMAADVTAAQELKPAHLTAIRKQLKDVAGKDVAITVSVDPALIGGLVVKLGSTLIDSSIKTKLTKMQLAMKGLG